MDLVVELWQVETGLDNYVIVFLGIFLVDMFDLVDESEAALAELAADRVLIHKHCSLQRACLLTFDVTFDLHDCHQNLKMC